MTSPPAQAGSRLAAAHPVTGQPVTAQSAAQEGVGSPVADLALLVRTAVHLRPGQIAHRTRLRTQRGLLRRWPDAGRRLLTGPAPATAVGWPAGFRPVDARMRSAWPAAAQLRSGQMTLLGVSRELGDPPDWVQADALRLWRFHLHYWDWAWGLDTARDQDAAREVFARLWQSWHAACGYGRGDAWHPYPAAMRAWSWCGLHASLVAGGVMDRPFVAELAAHAGFLRRHLESDVGGNHLIKNLKALAGLAVFFDDARLLDSSLRHLTRQLAIQVLGDGGHFERAPAYHCQVLADLIDVIELLRAVGEAPPPALDDAVLAMRRWLGVVLAPDGQVPLLNDGFPVQPDLLVQLRPGPPLAGPLLMLPDTGLVLAQSGGWRLLADVGDPCPAELPAHAHADTLSCVVHVDGAPLLVETGTSTYARGPMRDYERSTAAHNTVDMDGANSTEVWGAFRAARRARVHGVSARAEPGAVTVQAAHDGYRRLPGHPLHRRSWSLTAAGLDVEDVVTGRGRHSVTVHWHLPPGSVIAVEPAGTTATRTDSPAGPFRAHATAATSAAAFGVGICASSPVTLTVDTRPIAQGLGQVTPAPVLACRVDGELPIRVRTRWQRASHARSGSGPEVTA